MNTERGNVFVAVLVAIFLVLLFAGFFKGNRTFFETFNLKAVLHVPCGVTLENPKYDNQKIIFPITIEGYVNGCGWNVVNGQAGTAQIFDTQGIAVTRPVALAVPAASNGSPFYFTSDLKLVTPPRTVSGNLLITSTTGLLHTVPIIF